MSYDLPDAIILGRSSSIMLSISSLNMSNILAVHLSCKQKQSWMKSWLKICWGKCHQPCGPTLIWPLTKCCVVTMKCIALVTDSRVLFSSFSIWYVLMWCGGTCKRRWVYRRQTKRTETGVGQVLHRLAETRNQFVNIHQKLLHLSDRTCWRHQWRAELPSSSTTHHTPHTTHNSQCTSGDCRVDAPPDTMPEPSAGLQSAWPTHPCPSVPWAVLGPLLTPSLAAQKHTTAGKFITYEWWIDLRSSD